MIMGATGYLGSYISASLEKANSLFIICNNRYLPNRENFFCISKEEYTSVFEKNQIDFIINCMGVYQKKNNKEIVEGNLVFPLQVMDTAAKCGVRNIVNINTALPESLNLYSFTKRDLGRFGNFYSNQYGLNFYNLLVEMFYGADEPEERFLSSIINKMKKNADIELTEGTQKRDLVHVEDVCQAVRLIMDSGLKGYYDIPVGTGEGHTIRETVEYIHKKLNSSSKLLFGAIPMRQNEPDSIADISFLEGLGYKVRYSWEKGLEKMVFRNFT